MMVILALPITVFYILRNALGQRFEHAVVASGPT